MTGFATFQEAAEAARKMAIERQQSIHVFRVLDDRWSISSETRDMRNSGAALREPYRGSSIQRKPEVDLPDWEKFPF